ncbi:MAG: DUF255 domain-containing protein [Opitutus sp.]
MTFSSLPRSPSLVGLIALFCLGLSPVQAAGQLKNEASAFLRSYADGPVDWMPWGEAAFARAKSEQKPVLLVIGSFTSELSRAMHQQTFSNVETAAFLNSTFVCVLVDAKERRDVTALYQQYLQTVKQVNGLPMNLWLTPELKPFDGANYLPPTEEWGKEGFSTVAKRAAAGWKADAAAQRSKADDAVASVVAAQSTTAPEPTDDAAVTQIVADATEAWRARFDATNGGFGDPPKYPEPELLRYLLRDPASKELAVTTLQSVIKGALRDPLDGGFFRYVVDAEWHHPYFQKALADQARLALALLEGAKVTGDTQFSDAARDALQFCLTQLRTKDGDFAAAEDSTPEPIAAGYLWTFDEIRTALGEAAAKEFSAAYSVTAEGNIPADAFPGATTTGKNILYRSTVALSPTPAKSLRESAAKLLARRQQRLAPLRDNGATAGMHGLILEAFSRAGAQLSDAQLTAAARDEFTFVQQKLIKTPGHLRRVAGQEIDGAAEDYVLLARGLAAYSAVGKDPKAATLATALLETANTDFLDPKTGRFFATSAGAQPGMWARVTSPTVARADLPAPESVLLTAISDLSPAQNGKPELTATLLAAVSADVKEAAEVARGDLLLSLRPSAP